MSSIGDIIFYPIFINYLMHTNNSSWIIALVTVLEYFPRLIGPVISAKISQYSVNNVLVVSCILRFFCYMGVFIIIYNNYLGINGIILIIILNFISDLFGTVFYLNQNKIEKNLIPDSHVDSITNLIYLFSTIGMSLAYIVSPTINRIFSLHTIALANAIFFLLPLVELPLTLNIRISVDKIIKTKYAFKKFIQNKIIAYSVMLTFFLNFLIGNSTFIIVNYSKHFSISPLENIAKYSTLFLIGTICASFLRAVFTKVTLIFEYSILFSFVIISLFYLNLSAVPSNLSSVIYFAIGVSLGILQPLLNARIYKNSDSAYVSSMFAITSLLNSIGTIFSPFVLNIFFQSVGFINTVIIGFCYYLVGSLIVIKNIKSSKRRKSWKKV